MSDYLPLAALLFLACVGLLAFRMLCAFWSRGDANREQASSEAVRSQLPLAPQRLALLYLVCQGSVLLLLLWAASLRDLVASGGSPWLGAGAVLTVLFIGGVYVWRKGDFSW